MNFVKKEVADDSDSPSYKVMKTHMTNEEFKDRIKAICGPRTEPNPCVRVPGDAGYGYPPVIEAMMHGKRVVIDNTAGTITQKEAA